MELTTIGVLSKKKSKAGNNYFYGEVTGIGKVYIFRDKDGNAKLCKEKAEEVVVTEESIDLFD